MKSSHITVVILFILATVANFLGLTGRHDALCLDNMSVRLVWCYPYPAHGVPTFTFSAFAREAFILIFTGIAWFRVSKKPA